MKIEIDLPTNTITVNGVIISLDLLQHLTVPTPDTYYRFVRDGDVVTVRGYHATSLVELAQSGAKA